MKEGYPIAQQGFYGFDDLEPRSVRIELAICRWRISVQLCILCRLTYGRHYCPECTFFDPIAVPIIIDRCKCVLEAHSASSIAFDVFFRRDLEKIAPLWTKYFFTFQIFRVALSFCFALQLLRYTEAIRSEKDRCWHFSPPQYESHYISHALFVLEYIYLYIRFYVCLCIFYNSWFLFLTYFDVWRWDPAWNDSAQAVNAISWVAEMYATFVLLFHLYYVAVQVQSITLNCYFLNLCHLKFPHVWRYGYVLAASKLNIRHEIWSLQTVRIFTPVLLQLVLRNSLQYRSLEATPSCWERLRWCIITLRSRWLLLRLFAMFVWTGAALFHAFYS